MARRHILKDVRDLGLDPKKAHTVSKTGGRLQKKSQVVSETKPVPEAPAPVTPVVEELPVEAIEEVSAVEEVKKTTKTTSRKTTRSSTRSRTKSTTKKKEEK